MRPVDDTEKVFLVLHLLHWLPSDFILFQMTLEHLQEPSVVGSIDGVITMHHCFVQVVNRASETCQRLKHSKYQFRSSKLSQFLRQVDLQTTEILRGQLINAQVNMSALCIWHAAAQVLVGIKKKQLKCLTQFAEKFVSCRREKSHSVVQCPTQTFYLPSLRKD